MSDLSIDLGSLKLKNPIIAASGTFGYGVEFTSFLDLNKLGGFVVKGLYYEPREGNPPPRLVETASGLINAIGLQGIGVKNFSEKILPQIRDFDTALIVNVCGDDENEYARVAGYLEKKEGISAYELNISCPNIKKDGRNPAQDPEDTYRVVRSVKQVSSRPVIAKLSPNVTDITVIAQSAQEAGADAVSLVNTFLAMAVDVETVKPKLANVFGGLSGPAIKPIALRMVYQAFRRLQIPVVGIGGIMTAEDALEFFYAGARAVQIGTANFVQPDITLQILDDLVLHCRRSGISRIEDIIGKIHADSSGQ